MHFSILAINTLAACALAAPASGGLDARDLDFTVQFHSHPGCNAPGSGGPYRDYNKGTCLPLGGSANAVNIIDRLSECHLTSWTGSNCDGSARKLDANGCWVLEGRQSLSFDCPE